MPFPKEFLTDPNMVLNLQRIGRESIPGKLTTGMKYQNNAPVEVHEINHLLQAGRKMPLDDYARKLTPSANLSKTGKAQWDYFKEGSSGQEPTSYLAELRQSMLDRGIIKNIYDNITPNKLIQAEISFANKPRGFYDYGWDRGGKNSGFLSNTRVLDLYERTAKNREILSRALNKLPAAIPFVAASTALSQEQDGNGEAVMNNLDKVSAQRRDALNKAIETVVTSQGGSNDLSSLLLMTSAMENSYGADSTAYENPETGGPRTYTRGMMSIDDIAYDDLYKPRGEKGKYSAKQLQNYKWLESLGLDYKNIDQKLRSNDPLANIATARLQYSRAVDPLPKSSDLDGMYNYYMKYYNRTDADHKDRFTQFYNELIAKEKEGGEPDMLSTYKNYINGKVKSQEAVNVYDKLNRIHLKDARSAGMTVPNYIMTYV
jgi:hypothetical protein